MCLKKWKLSERLTTNQKKRERMGCFKGKKNGPKSAIMETALLKTPDCNYYLMGLTLLYKEFNICSPPLQY